MERDTLAARVWVPLCVFELLRVAPELPSAEGDGVEEPVGDGVAEGVAEAEAEADQETLFEAVREAVAVMAALCDLDGEDALDWVRETEIEGALVTEVVGENVGVAEGVAESA